MRFHPAAGVRRQLVDEVVGQERNVLLALAQRRNVERHHVEPVIKIFAKGALLQRGAQILVGGGDHAHVDVARHVAAQALELALLQDAQQLHLNGGGHVADLVQEDGAGVGLLELAGLGGLRAGESAFLVAEQLALHQVFGDGGAVDLHQRPVAARRVEMDGAGDQVLADAAFAGQQHGGARGRHALDGGEDLLHGGAAADDVVELVAAAQLLLQLRGSRRAARALRAPCATTCIR